MTVVYNDQVATGSRGFGNFYKLLFRWYGSIYKLVLPDLCVYIILYYSINLPYRFLLRDLDDDDERRKYFHKFVKYSREAASLIPLQFILGFYVSQVVHRWWSQFMTTPWPDTLAVTVATGIRGHDDRGRLMRRTILRYMNTALVMVFTMISPQARERFPTMDDLVSAGFLVPHERLIIDHLNEKTPGPKYYVPIVWAGAVAAKARKEGRIKDDIALYHVLKEICKYRTMAGDLLSYDWVNIPLVYTQVTTLATYVYFLSCLVGKQFLKEEGEVDIYVPVFLLLEFTFMMGWLKVAETMINPFGEDDDDFEVNWLIDRNITISYVIVDEMNDEFPEMLKDAFWEGVIPDELMYTPEALKYKTEGMGGGSAAIQEEIDTKSQRGNPSTANSRFSMFHINTRSRRSEDAEVGRMVKQQRSEEDVAQFLEHGKAPEYKDSYDNIEESKSKSKPKKKSKSQKSSS